MKDSIILGTGNSRYLKSVADFKTLYPTYDDFAAALVAGTLPIDLNGINAAGFQQVGDALSKETLLNDYTASLYGLENTAVLNDVFLKLFHGISADVLFENVLSNTTSIIDLRDIDRSRYSLFAFVCEGEDDTASFSINAISNLAGDPIGSNYENRFYSYMDTSQKISSWKNQSGSVVSKSGKNSMFLFNFNNSSISTVSFNSSSFEIGYGHFSNDGVYGISIHKSTGQHKIKILGLNFR